MQQKNQILCNSEIDVSELTEAQCKEIGMKTLMGMCDELVDFTQ